MILKFIILYWIITYRIALELVFSLEGKMSTFLLGKFIIKFSREIRYNNNEGRGRRYLQ